MGENRIWLKVFTLICFGTICLLTFFGYYNNFYSGLLLIIWTLAGYMRGRCDEKEKTIEDMDNTIKKLEDMLGK